MSKFNIRRNYIFRARLNPTITFAGRRIKVTNHNKAEVERLQILDAQRAFEVRLEGRDYNSRIAV